MAVLSIVPLTNPTTGTSERHRLETDSPTSVTRMLRETLASAAARWGIPVADLSQSGSYTTGDLSGDPAP